MYPSQGLFLRSKEFFETEIEKPKNDLLSPVGYQDGNNSQIMIKSGVIWHNHKILDIFKIILQKFEILIAKCFLTLKKILKIVSKLNGSFLNLCYSVYPNYLLK